ncbi:L,D-transpeptidase family protein [Metabacillus idriensis]|uniref:L,D-transpeptidase family protein n=1 Tax=Metabacillus idriensis TaxID=324768 RepID=UPI00174EA0C4|nr:L,D-transpeptidase family protein [Metabacillus idriensis]MCM3596881.1 L,D-transpeptidase family protein [Metabacillus idriensis]
MKKTLVIFTLALIMFFGAGISKSYAAGSDFIIINKSKNQLAYYQNSKLSSVFRVATGRQPSYTPEGKFKIVSKIVNRPYYKKGIPGGDPRNPLGNRWLGINARGTWGTTYAIHGNNNPNSIGQYISDGCIRMFDNEVEWLYGQVKMNTPVIITTSGKTFDSIALASGYKVSGSKAVPSKPAASSGQNLRKGSRGSEVKQLQQLLTSKGFNTKGIDGIFGNNTDKAVRSFQKSKKLTADGIVGPNTRKALSMY